MVVVEGENVLHHVKGKGNCQGGGMSGGICPGNMSTSKCPDPVAYHHMVGRTYGRGTFPAWSERLKD